MGRWRWVYNWNEMSNSLIRERSMPSIFPGMDPFIEAQKWNGFHHYFIGELGQTLVTKLRPRYEVAPEERIYVETAEPEPSWYRADVAIARGDKEHARPDG